MQDIQHVCCCAFRYFDCFHLNLEVLLNLIYVLYENDIVILHLASQSAGSQTTTKRRR